MKRPFLTATIFSAIILGLAGQSGPSVGQERGGDKHAAGSRKCADECGACQRACDNCATHCADLLAQGKKEHLVTLHTCQDCATTCSAAASIVARKGPFADIICKACIEACARCSKECEKHSHDAEMKQCAEACRRCEQACRDMLAHTTGKTTERRGD